MDLKDLTTKSVKLPDGQESSLLELLNDWAGRVLKLEESAQPAAGDELAGIKEFVASLLLRDRLEQAIADAAESSVPALVKAVDALYSAYTLRDDHKVLSRMDSGAPTEPWWWGRIPAGGPLAAEFSRQARKLR
jgi:hypothetical protein